ncbi:MAG: ABC transporter permease [Candidatus Eremiobacteraeota bacterium]|nr:ABC transporter permease [Candidatus Eremiobacteraeota bacterium]
MTIRLVKRENPEWWMPAAVFLVSLLAALLIAGVLMAFMGVSPLRAYKEMIIGAFGTPYGLSETLVKAIPLMMMGLGVGLAFRMVLWNIGAEGQYCLGAICAAGLALAFPALPAMVMIPLMIAMGFLGGALWGLVPGALRAYLGTSEIVTSLMLNYVGIYFLEYLVYGPWKDPRGYQFPMTAILPETTFLPQFGITRVHAGIVIALFMVALFWVIMKKTKWGYEVRVTGENPGAARYCGIKVERNILLVMLVSGGLAGLAGMCELSGVQHRLQHGFALGYGYTAIIIAWLARLNPLSIILVSVLFAGLMTSGDLLQMNLGAGAGLEGVIQGIILFFILAGGLFCEYRIVTGKE